MHKQSKNILFILLSTLMVFIVQAKNTDQEIQRLEAIAKNITIIRDDFGVPHVYGKTDAQAVFGMLYAQAEDDFNRIERNYIWATGRLAEIEGEASIYSDLRARLYMTVDEAKQAYEESPKWLKELCDAFADGLNYYLLTHPEVQPKLLTKFEPWMPMFFSEGSIGGDIESVPLDGIKELYGDKKARAALKVAANKPFKLEEPVGSNGFAISGKLTQSGNTMLLINPHTSIFFRGEMHVVSEEGLNAYGAVTWGQFFIYQGFNENTGWMHTSTLADFKDEFIEKVSTQKGQLVYQYGDEFRPVETSTIHLKYSHDDKVLSKDFQVYHTHHGPIVAKKDGNWHAFKINWDPVNALKQSFIRTKLKNHDEFRTMMDIRTNSSNNTVYADSSGNIAYYHGNFIPKRNTKFDYSKPVDGSIPETDWQGPHDVNDIVTVLNPANGWIQNCNATPFTSAAAFSPKAQDYPKYMAPEPDNFRGIHAVQVLTGESDFTLDKLISVAYDPYLPALELIIADLVKAYDQAKVKDLVLEKPIDTLRNWNYRVSKDSIAMTMAHFYALEYLQAGIKNSANPVEGYLGYLEFVQDFIMGKAQLSAEVNQIQILTSIIAKINNDFGRWQTPWGEVMRYQRNNGEIQQVFDDNLPSTPIGLASARWGALASFNARGEQNTKRIYGTNGNSFVAVVEFGEKVSAKSLLAGGQSGDPLSPHFDNQVTLYQNGEFKDVAFYREDVEKRAQKTYNPGE
ncbi:MAG: penicillin acylase family protein [Marinicellaceae bacterium]